MGSSVSKSESGSTGSEWTGKLYFDPEADKSGPIYPIRDDELCTRLKEFVDLNEKILQLEIHTHPLNDARAAKRLPSVSGIWIEGAGHLPAPPGEAWRLFCFQPFQTQPTHTHIGFRLGKT